MAKILPLLPDILDRPSLIGASESANNYLLAACEFKLRQNQSVAEYCRRNLDFLYSRLSAGQRLHLRNFSLDAQNLLALRCLARRLLFLLNPDALWLDDERNIYSLSGKIGYCCFSYADNTAFCLMARTETNSIAIDAVNKTDSEFTKQAKIYFSQLLDKDRPGIKMSNVQLWTLYETIIKLYNIKCANMFVSHLKDPIQQLGQNSVFYFGHDKISCIFFCHDDYLVALTTRENAHVPIDYDQGVAYSHLTPHIELYNVAF